MAKVIMLVGGSRSGKSAYAEQIACQIAARDRLEVYYLATATIWDEEFAQRVQKHRQRRPAAWHTIEEACDIEQILLEWTDKTGVFLIDGIGTWVANLMYRDNSPDFSWDSIREKAFLAKVARFVESWPAIAGTIILVADEVGMAVVPENEQARIFRDLNGWTNQCLAKEVSELYLLSCGIPLQIK